MKLTCLILGLGLLGVHAAHLGPREAADCQPELCNNQNCRCFSPGTVPGGFAPSEIPQVFRLCNSVWYFIFQFGITYFQVVLVTFDDAVTQLLYDNYYSDAFANRQNPNGCPIRATFFASHEYTDYHIINSLRNEGHEIALHSIS